MSPSRHPPDSQHSATSRALYTSQSIAASAWSPPLIETSSPEIATYSRSRAPLGVTTAIGGTSFEGGKPGIHGSTPIGVPSARKFYRRLPVIQYVIECSPARVGLARFAGQARSS